MFLLSVQDRATLPLSVWDALRARSDIARTTQESEPALLRVAQPVIAEEPMRTDPLSSVYEPLLTLIELLPAATPTKELPMTVRPDVVTCAVLLLVLSPIVRSEPLSSFSVALTASKLLPLRLTFASLNVALECAVNEPPEFRVRLPPVMETLLLTTAPLLSLKANVVFVEVSEL